MLIIPHKAIRELCVIGIDPGINNTGVSIFTMDVEQRIILSIDATTLITQKLPNRTGLTEELYGERTIKLYKLKSTLLDIMTGTMPAGLICESPFYNRRMPMAYGALLEVLCVIQSAVIEHNCNTFFTTLEPLVVKKVVGAGAKAGKEDVKRAISEIPQIMGVLRPNIDTLDEHAIDAIAIAYTYLVLNQHL